MEQYHNLLKKILTSEKSGYKPNRTLADTISHFGAQEEFDLSKGFPLVTTKQTHLKSIVYELMWFLKGETNIKYLNDNGVRIWDEWADENGNLGPVYGKQWRSWKGYDGNSIDQLQNSVNTLKKNPASRQNIVSAWNVAQVKEMALPPCHLLFQFNVQERKGEKMLDLQLYQRSCDVFLGVPFNIASYALLQEIVANETNLKPGLFVHTFGDLHIYCGEGERGKFYGENFELVKNLVGSVNERKDYLEVKKQLEGMMVATGKINMADKGDHVPMCLEQLAREPRPLPKLKLHPDSGINNMEFEYIELSGYDPHPPIRGKVAV